MEYRQRVEWCIISRMRTAKWNIGSKPSGMSSAERLVKPSIGSGVLEHWQRADQKAEWSIVSELSGALSAEDRIKQRTVSRALGRAEIHRRSTEPSEASSERRTVRGASGREVHRQGSIKQSGTPLAEHQAEQSTMSGVLSREEH
jgi:hypothetical protein